MHALDFDFWDKKHLSVNQLNTDSKNSWLNLFVKQNRHKHCFYRILLKDNTMLMCQICLTTKESDNITDSSCYSRLFIQILSLKVSIFVLHYNLSLLYWIDISLICVCRAFSAFKSSDHHAYLSLKGYPCSSAHYGT